ncbi:MAG: 2-oxo acid dehydrogenase subunit E2 [Candidatus Marinimicrobia bacterium]|jgi:2-oxoglutarate dehydrogenase E2 component (dihydrolipoamide succinyltransferase)|nr:2-oxo acid dehydrogenase subunit E2 [Candidatus Neomarinimicrobiota bacterium]MBT4362458.1 2-oxo acid dehydrogenase subunit E2 [Candidatus Neomarinimicrobiota bacterium]MBT4714539.1 2-oxo acid dehydrogenase subunit E2 [Candidatus Neomarinimicrobiota bacterium]MBT4946578.1 2-oxo acid dehydrogenase subunit E2 [Candidatus Neomarinimicrobiota bacterium]MBT5270343.1 2-oxo acid dehydrogenase subunit E2 [Candidatus Neomarinimicrobiota bacterium]
MIFDIVMPKMGESLTEGTVLEWKKDVGETIDKDETLLEIATDKVDAEIPCPVSGTLVEIIGEVNQTYDIDTIIARVETSDSVEASPAKTGSTHEKQAADKLSGSSRPTISIQAPVTFDDNRVYSPLVRSIATQEGITPAELQQIPGSGFRGRVSKKDVLFYLETRGSGGKTPIPISGLEETGLADRVSPDDVEIIDMDSMRKSIAKHMRKSVDTSAHVYSVSEADMTDIMNFISENNDDFKAKHGHSLTVTHFITTAVRDALLSFPMINTSLDGTRIIRHKHLNIGIAVAVGDGLVVPPVRNAEGKSLKEISDDISSIVSKARDKKLTLEDLEGATFSITNFGVFGNLAGFPIINQPNVAILGVGVIKKRPVVIEAKAGDEIAIRQMCVFTLGFDHRLVDGAMGGQFIEHIMRNLESFDFNALA